MNFLLYLVFFAVFQKTYGNYQEQNINRAQKLREAFGLILSLLFFVILLDGSIPIVAYYVGLVYLYHVNAITKKPALLAAVSPLLIYRLAPYFDHLIPEPIVHVLPSLTEKATFTDIKYMMAPVGMAFITLTIIDLIMNSSCDEKLSQKLLFIFYPPKVLGPIDTWKKFSKHSFKEIPLTPIVASRLGLTLISSAIRVGFAFYTQNQIFYILDLYGKVSFPILLLPAIGFAQMCVYFNSIQGMTELSQEIAQLGSKSLPDNFKNLHSSRFFSEFWQRWHINITRFFGYNLYRPLRQNNLPSHISTMVVFLTFGLWHGTYIELILFGALSGILIVLEGKLDLKPNRLRTFLIMSLVFVLSVPTGLFHRLDLYALFDFELFWQLFYSISLLLAAQIGFFLIAGYSSKKKIGYFSFTLSKLPESIHLLTIGIIFGIAYLSSPFLLNLKRIGYGYL
jgi:alginate O-acetyltransferase complex protein AlgI